MSNTLQDIKDIEGRIGISSHFIPSTNGETLLDAMNKVHNGGYNGFEIVPSDGQAQLGYPFNYPNVGLWYRDMTEKDKEMLKEVASKFDFVTIHGPHLDLNIASSNRGIREESIRQYKECLELAVELGSKTVTFHGGGPVFGYIRDSEIVTKYNIEFAKSIIGFAESHDLYLGYEVGQFDELKRIVEEVDSPRFGINLDIGHSIMAGNDPIEYIKEFKEKIMEVHMNGVCHYWGGFMEHVPVHRNNAIDYQAFFTKLRESGYKGPIICELQGNDLQQVIEVCDEAKEMIAGIWNNEIVLEEKWNRKECESG